MAAPISYRSLRMANIGTRQQTRRYLMTLNPEHRTEAPRRATTDHGQITHHPTREVAELLGRTIAAPQALTQKLDGVVFPIQLPRLPLRMHRGRYHLLGLPEDLQMILHQQSPLDLMTEKSPFRPRRAMSLHRRGRQSGPRCLHSLLDRHSVIEIDILFLPLLQNDALPIVKLRRRRQCLGAKSPQLQLKPTLLT